MVDSVTLLESECKKDLSVNRRITLLYENPKLTVKQNERIGGLFSARSKVKQNGQNYADYLNALTLENIDLPATENLQDESLVIKGTPIFKSDKGSALDLSAPWITGIEKNPQREANEICQWKNQRLIDFYDENQVYR